MTSDFWLAASAFSEYSFTFSKTIFRSLFAFSAASLAPLLEIMPRCSAAGFYNNSGRV